MQIVYRARIFLIKLGKSLPFILCALVLLSNIENVIALYNENYVSINGIVILDKKISRYIGMYFEYNIQTLLITCVISIAIETCIYNKIACFYLAINLYEKYFFSNNMFDDNVYYITSIANIIISSFFVYKGIKIILKH